MSHTAATGTSRTTQNLTHQAVAEISETLRLLLADVFTLYMKTKSFHWHIAGRHFRDHHLLLDEQSNQILAMTDDIAERTRKIGGWSLRSIGEISRLQRLRDNDSESVLPLQMLEELRRDNATLTHFLRSAHGLCSGQNDLATASLIEVWIDQAEHRTWFLTVIVSDL